MRGERKGGRRERKGDRRKGEERGRLLATCMINKHRKLFLFFFSHRLLL